MFSWYLERRGLKGKDMGRRGTALEDKEMCAAAQRRALVSARRARLTATRTPAPPFPRAAPLPSA